MFLLQDPANPNEEAADLTPFRTHQMYLPTEIRIMCGSLAKVRRNLQATPVAGDACVLRRDRPGTSKEQLQKLLGNIRTRLQGRRPTIAAEARYKCADQPGPRGRPSKRRCTGDGSASQARHSLGASGGRGAEDASGAAPEYRLTIHPHIASHAAGPRRVYEMVNAFLDGPSTESSEGPSDDVDPPERPRRRKKRTMREFLKCARALTALEIVPLEGLGGPPPEAGLVAVVLTNVWAIESVWRRAKALTTRSLQLHHELLQSLVGEWHGHVLQVEGDEWLVAFGTTAFALDFALQLQLRLLRLPWDQKLSGFDAAATVYAREGDALVYAGLRVRSIVHVLEPRRARVLVSRQPGPRAVARALRTRLRGAKGGQVLLTQGAHDWVEKQGTAVTTGAIFEWLRRDEEAQEDVYHAVPVDLQDRLAWLQDHQDVESVSSMESDHGQLKAARALSKMQELLTAFQALIPADPKGHGEYLVLISVWGAAQLWTKECDVFARALSLHHGVVWALLSHLRGVLLYAEGDQIVVCFEDAVATADFALALQQRLLQVCPADAAPWRPEVLSLCDAHFQRLLVG